MKKSSLVSQEVFKSCVLAYEKNVLNSTLVSIPLDSPLLLLFKAVRRSKLVAIVSEKEIAEEIDSILQAVQKLINQDETLSENVEIFTCSVVSDSQHTAYSARFIKVGLSLTITDQIQIKAIEEFHELFSGDDGEIDYDSSLYEYLSMSNDVTDVKNSLFHALLLMLIYNNQPVSQETLERLLHEKYGKSAGDVPLAIKALRKEKKFTTPGKGGKIKLREDEETRLEQSLKEEKALEADFRNRYDSIALKYGIDDNGKVLDLLRDAYQAQYQWHSHMGDDEKKREDASKENFEKIRLFVEKLIGTKANAFITELRAICRENNYLSRFCLSHSFLELYRSSGYEKYINSKGSCIILDTPVVTSLLCYLTKLDEGLDEEWDNVDYQSVKMLAKLKEKSKGKIQFYIPFDYLQETVGEIKKALQFSWFDNIDWEIPFETGNTFYNFYLFIRKSRQNKGDNVNNLSFQKFVSELGLDETNPDASLFAKRTHAFFKYFLEKTDNYTIEPVKERFDCFDRVREIYETDLQYRGRKKTFSAVISDVRQALNIAKESTCEENCDANFFIATWDKTLRRLRDIVNEELILMSSYSVMNPSNLATKLAYKNFCLNGNSVSEDVFAYAESGYNFVGKVQSLYDNVLTPYFANASNHNTSLVQTMLKMEKDCQDSETNDDGRNKESTVLADIFLPIVYALPEKDLSVQNLKEFLADENNNEFVIALLQEAFDEYLKGNNLDISERFCERMKERLSKMDEEIIL